MDEVAVQSAATQLPRTRLMPAQADFLSRPQLESALKANPHARVLLLAAPAGFGKTSCLLALAHEREQSGHAVAWLSLVPEDDEPGQFLRNLIDALAAQLSGFGDDAKAYLQNVMYVPVAAVMESLLVHLTQLESPVLLVLDDLHVIQNPELISALNRLIKFAPQGFTLAIGCRSQPALNLATLRAKDLLLEIGEKELRLSPDEARLYLSRSGLELEPAVFASLYEQTEGWLVGLQLACLWLRHRADANSPISVLGDDQDEVGEYLLRSVFEQMPTERQELLLALGIAQQLSGDLANALTGRQDGQQLLEEIEGMQLFLLPMDHERHWYRFHNLFAEFLRNRLREREPERFKQLHFNASLWFTNHHMQNLAIEHACLAEDPEMLAALVDGCGLELINRGQLHLIYRWRQRVPNEIAERFPILVLADVWTRAAEMGLSEANRMLDELIERWSETRGQGTLNDKLLAALAVKSVLALQKDDLQTCVMLARRIEAQLGQHAAFLEVAILIVGALASVMLAQPDEAKKLLALAQQRNHFLEGRYLDIQLSNVEVLLSMERGHIRQAELLAAQLRSRIIPWFAERSRALAIPTISEALIAYSQGRLEGIEERLRWALATLDVINPIDIYAQGMLCLAHIQRLRDNAKEAQNNLMLMQNLSVRNKTWRFYTQAVADEIVQILQEPAADRVKRAEQRWQSVEWSKLAEHYQHMRFNPVLWVRGLSRVRLQQARGHYSEALHEISQLRGLLLDNWHGMHLLRLDLLAALSYQRLGYQERSHSLLLQCLIGAEREGVRSLFIEEGEAIRQLLQQLEIAERQPAMQGFIRSVLALWPGQKSRQAQGELEEELTERECEVVKLAAEGLSNEEIGKQLALALGTVKWHLHNIYEKLKVRNRTQAIRRARELSLLET
jgi:LuxR family maltose regulon positive regulatory protein